MEATFHPPLWLAWKQMPELDCGRDDNNTSEVQNLKLFLFPPGKRHNQIMQNWKDHYSWPTETLGLC